MTPREADDPDATPLPDEVARLAAELEAAIRAWERDPVPWPERRFDSLALRVFRVQHEHVRPYRRYCDARGARPGEVDDWRAIPPVPTAAFRGVELSAAPSGGAGLRFRTSGTTRGETRRGTHVVPAPSLYRASAEAGFHRFVLDGAGYPRAVRPDRPSLEPPVPVLSLVPSHADSDDASLSWMCDAVRARFGGPGSVVVADSAGVDWEAARAWVRRAADGSTPVVVLATTLALDGWTRRLEEGTEEIRLPDGSRVMDTGGAKGRPGLRREDVLARIDAALGVSPDRVVNELGMTELLSQRYDAPADGRLHGPPWLRSRALDPVTLEPVPEGEEGILCHTDLANVTSVCTVLTEDLGTVEDGAVDHRGRARGAPPRGCSLATAELLEAEGSKEAVGDPAARPPDEGEASEKGAGRPAPGGAARDG